MSELALQTKRRWTSVEKASETLGRCAEMNKHMARALGKSEGRTSQMTRKRYPLLDVAFDFVDKFARYDRTRASPIPVALGIQAAESGYGDLDTEALLHELARRVGPMRDATEVAMDIMGILALLAERGVVQLEEER